MDKQALSPRELELIFESCLGISLVDLEEDDIKFFFEKVAPRVSASKHIREFLLKRGIIELPAAFYEKYKLQFPLTFNPLGVVIAAIKDFTKPVSLEGTPR
jgi:hypothetical protein